MFIVIEGIDGTGKSTQVQQLADWLREQGHEVVTSFEPTNKNWGKKLRDSMTTGRLDPEQELEYFLKDRAEHVDELIRPALAAGKVVILDRYYFSTMAYQGARGFDPVQIRQQNEAFAPVPDHLIILDLDVETAHARIGGRGDTTNEFEQRDTLSKCRDIFLSLQNEPFARRIDANMDIEEVQRAIREAIRSPHSE